MTADVPTRARKPASDPNARYGVRDRPDVHALLERLGPSYKVTVSGALRAELIFREVRLDRDPAAEVQVRLRGERVFRTTTTLSLTGRDRIAKVAQEMTKVSDYDTWRHAVHDAVEQVMDAEEQLDTVDLRAASSARRSAVFVAGHFLVDGPTLLVMPGEGGKSTLARAAGAVSIAAGREIVPGIPPRVKGPVLYVAAEAPLVASHRRSIEAICRGAGLSIDDIGHSIELYRTRGRPLHRIARSIAERAVDFALVVLDSLQALQIVSEHSAGIRERDTIFWNAVDQIERPVWVIAHPNREDARRWNRSDGRAAGSDVTRDRARIAWAGRWRDEKAIEGTSYRRYTLRCTKFNDGPRPAAIGIGMTWVHGTDDDDPGTVYFNEVEPEARMDRDEDQEQAATSVAREANEGEISKVLADTLEAWQAGARTPGALRKVHPELSEAAAKMRLRRLRESGLLGPDDPELGL